MKFGIDCLGGVKYSREVARLDKNLAVGIFAETFGDASALIGGLLKQGRTVRVQLTWADDHNYTDRHFRRAAELVKAYRRFAVENKNRFFVSPFCEHRLKTPDAYLNRLQALAPEMVLVNSPDGFGSLSSKYLNEVHGEDKRTPKGEYLYSYDGTAAVDSDVEAMKKKRAGAILFFMWTYQCNGRANDHDDTPRIQRAAWPNADLLASLKALTVAKSSDAALPKNHLWKSHAEQTTNGALTGDRRACKPVLISPIKVPQVKLIDGAGKVVAVSSAPQPFSDGKRWRYYFPQYGYKYGVVKLQYGNKINGVVDGGFRENEYRS